MISYFFSRGSSTFPLALRSPMSSFAGFLLTSMSSALPEMSSRTAISIPTVPSRFQYPPISV